MGILDDKIIKKAMSTFGVSQEEAEQQLQDLVDLGLIEKGPDDNRLTLNGIKYAHYLLMNKRLDN